jgi:hypothetical protein
MRYGKVESGEIVKVYEEKPKWFIDDGSQVPDSMLIERDIYPITENYPTEQGYIIKPMDSWIINVDNITTTFWEINKQIPSEYNPMLHNLVKSDDTLWTYTDTTVTQPYTIEDKTENEISSFVSENRVVGMEDSTGYIEKHFTEWNWNSSEEQVEKTYWEIIEDPNKSNYSEFLYDINLKDFSEWVFDTVNDTAQMTYDYIPAPLDDAKERMRSFVAHFRWQVEVGGFIWTELNPEGDKIPTDRESQTKLMAAFVSAKDGIVTTDTRWKIIDGYITLNPTQMQNMCLSVQNFIQALYDREYDLRGEIDSSDFSNLETILNNIDTGWHSGALFLTT